MLGTLALLNALLGQQVGGELDLLRLLEARPPVHHLFGTTCAAGDRDRDGFPDFYVGNSVWDAGWMRDAGLVALFSGDTGDILEFGTGHMPHLNAGAAIADAGDVDGDGTGDLIVGTRNEQFAIIDNYVRVYSGASGAILFEKQHRGRNSTLGTAVDGAGDFDRDGFADFLFGDLSEGVGGVVTIVSGRTRVPLQRFRGGAADGIGWDAVVVGDADGDGTDDVATSNYFLMSEGMYGVGRVWLMSGATGAFLWSRDGETANGSFGFSLARAGDVDRDGAADVLAGAHAGGSGREGIALVLSGRDGREIRRYAGPVAGGEFGRGVVSGRDFDGDGVDEHLISAPLATFPGAPLWSGAAYLYSGAEGGLLAAFEGGRDHGLRSGSSFLGHYPDDRAELFIISEWGYYSQQWGTHGSFEIWAFRPFIGLSRHEVSAAAGGTIAVPLQFPPQYAGHRYALLFSSSGRGPSIWRGLDLPLAQDAVFRASAAGRYPAGVDHPVGILNGQARADARLHAGPQDLAAFVGTTFHVAAVVFDPITGLPIRSSVGAAFTVRP